MNPQLNLLFSRRSIRQYTSDDVSPDVVHDLLEAAMAAPSACCNDPWHFIVIRKPSMLSAIAHALPNGQMLATCPVGILICGDLQQAHDGQLSYLLQDCSAAIENMLLAANSLGLGACWLGIHPREERITQIRQLVHLPDHVLPVSAISVGWPAEQKEDRTRYQESHVHTELF